MLSEENHIHSLPKEELACRSVHTLSLGSMMLLVGLAMLLAHRMRGNRKLNLQWANYWPVVGLFKSSFCARLISNTQRPQEELACRSTPTLSLGKSLD